MVYFKNNNILRFAPHVAYTMAKFGMSFCVLGMATEFKDYNIGVNALWPRTSVATAAVKNMLGGDEMMKTSRVDTVNYINIILFRLWVMQHMLY
jgi:NAD(P)-dependent dehydrogenase (short-subunit alcohol dehydrogenase family)